MCACGLVKHCVYVHDNHKGLHFEIHDVKIELDHQLFGSCVILIKALFSFISHKSAKRMCANELVSMILHELIARFVRAK